MNVKRFLLLPGALALALSFIPLLPVVAQNQSAPAGQAPARQYQKRGINLNLTEDQKAQLKQIRESTRSQIDAVLTPEQKAQLASAKQQRQQGQQGQQQGRKSRNVWASLNLSADQKAQIRSIRETAKQKSDAVLTAEQRQQLQQKRQQMRQNRPQQRQNPQS